MSPVVDGLGGGASGAALVVAGFASVLTGSETVADGRVSYMLMTLTMHATRLSADAPRGKALTNFFDVRLGLRRLWCRHVSSARTWQQCLG